MGLAKDQLAPIVTNHVRIDGYANGWIINIPGTYALTIFYGLQNYAEFGVYVSIATLLSIVSIAIVKDLKGRSQQPWLRKFFSIIHSRGARRNERDSRSAKAPLDGGAFDSSN